MGFFVNPFKKHLPTDADLIACYEPLPLLEEHAPSDGLLPPGAAPIKETAKSDEKTSANLKTDSPTLSANKSSADNELEKGNGNIPSIEAMYSANNLDAIRAAVDSEVAASGHDTIYDRKSKVINIAIQHIGLGKYQWQLFTLCGFGWLADNLWLQGLALTLPPISAEFGISENYVRYTTCATFVGLCVGAAVWGISSDVIGRRPVFNLSLFIGGVFGVAIGGAPNWIAACALWACLGFGIGGNLPVDGALFLEFLPFANSNLLTFLSVWWPVGQLVASLIAWGFIPNYSCTGSNGTSLPSCNLTAPGVACCNRENNQGWRYFVFTMGALTLVMFLCRFFLFHLYESPKFLLSRGRQAEAVATVYGIAKANGKKTWLNEDILNEIGGFSESPEAQKLSVKQIVSRSLEKFSTHRIKPLFATRKLGLMTVLIWICWATIGMGYPLFNAFLPQFLSNSGKGEAQTSTYIAYRNYVITSVVGVPGSIIAWWTVNLKYVGRRGTIAVATLITGILLFIFTLSSDPNFEVTLSSLEAFFQNIMYGVLYAYTPEVFPAPNRGTGTGIASFFNRITGLCAPIVAVQAGGVNPNAPVYAAGSLILAAFLAMCCFPIETRGKQLL